jgi:murein DD-endopeptidase MepM/ murein hydrolase activator NlpD
MDRRDFIKGLSAIVLSSSFYPSQSFGQLANNSSKNNIDDTLRILEDNDLYAIKLHSRTFRRGDAIVVEIEPKIPFHEIYMTTNIKKPGNKGLEDYSFLSQTIPFNNKLYSITGTDFLCPSQTMVLNFTMTSEYERMGKSYALDIGDRKFETQYLPALKKNNPKYQQTPEQIADYQRRSNKEKIELPRHYKNDTYASYITDGYVRPRPTCDSWTFGVPRFNYSRYKNGRQNNDRTKAIPRSPHRGVDCDGRTGDNIRAALSGKAVFVEPLLPGIGSVAMLDHGLGLYTFYGHMSEQFVKTGQEVKANDVIGEVGTTGGVFGSHLHFQAKLHSMNIDPESLEILNKVFR